MDAAQSDIMISFIVIGRNEERNLKRCIEGIYKAVAYCEIDRYEVIYVDSGSTDRSLEIVKSYPEVKIFLVTGERNAAIGRNIGGKEATGKVLFFIDADMEIFGEFLASVWDEDNNDINEPFVSGNLLDIVGKSVNERVSSKYIPGGIFLIRASIWHSVNGMRTKFTAGEDYDLGLRIAEKGFVFKRKNLIITNHFTVPTMHRSRIWKAVWSKYMFYPRCVLLRHHLFNKRMYRLLVSNDKTFVIMLLTIIAALINESVGLFMAGVYVVAVAIRSFYKMNFLPFFQMMGYFMITDFLNLVYFFTFFPKDKKERYVNLSPAEVVHAH